jgi:hypothetical protein
MLVGQFIQNKIQTFKKSNIQGGVQVWTVTSVVNRTSHEPFPKPTGAHHPTQAWLNI